MLRRLALLSACLLLLSPGTAFAVEEPETWCDTSLASHSPQQHKNAQAIVLLDDTLCDIDATGMRTITYRYVVRISTAAGARHATRRIGYDSKVDKVKSLRAWLIRSGKKTEKFKDSDWADVCGEDAATLSSDHRARVINLTDKAVAGDLFACEVVVRAPMLTSMLRQKFGNSLPVVTERLTVNAPAGFELRPQVRGPVPLQQTLAGNRGSWTLQHRPHRPEEAHMIDDAWVDSDLLVSIVPPAGAAGYSPRTFTRWADVAAWIEELNIGTCDSSPALQAKVRELTADCPDALARIRALATHVQKLRYVANNEGLARGLGFRARPASLVFGRGFGDCKDKANLLRAMLREAGITSHTVAVYSGSEYHVRPELPDPGQFNHAIIAIEVDPSTSLPAVLHGTPFGSLLFFDPTQTHTGLGDLPPAIQGTPCHVEAPGSDTLLTLPRIHPGQGALLAREARLSIQRTGLVEVDCSIRGNGRNAAALRGMLSQCAGKAALDEFVLGMLGPSVHTGALKSRDIGDDPLANTVTIRLSTATGNFLQPVSGGVFIARFDIFGRSYVPVIAEKERRLAIEMPCLQREDSITYKLPEDLVVTELPRAQSIDHDYGTFRLKVVQEGQTVTLHRSLTLHKQAIPAEDMPKVKAFLSALSRADRSSMLLKLVQPEKPAPPPSGT